MEPETTAENVTTASASAEFSTPQATESATANSEDSAAPATAANRDTSGDNIAPKDLVGTWKLIAADEDGKVTTDNSKFEELVLAFYWVEFKEDGTAIFSTAPQKGESDTVTPYKIENGNITFTGESFTVTSGKMVDGKLLIMDDSSSITGGKNAVFTLEKQ